MACACFRCLQHGRIEFAPQLPAQAFLLVAQGLCEFLLG
jgi:hypothetical protein